MNKVYLLFILITCTFFSVQPVFSHSDDCDAHPTDDEMHDEHCAVMALVHEEDATHVAVNNGSWSSGSTWNTGTVPNAGAKVLIDSGVTVSYVAESETEIFWLRINGTLEFSTTVNTKLKVNTIVVDPMGTLTIGTESTPVSPSVTAKIIFTDDGEINTTWDPYLFSKGLISHGVFTAYGASKTAFGSIAEEHLAGTTRLKLTTGPLDWAADDKLILAGTFAHKGGTNALNTRFHDEQLTLTSVSGKNVYFTNDDNGGATSLLYDHIAPEGYNLKFHVANLTRNIVFETENWQTLPLAQRAHIMLMHNINQSVYYTEFIGMGRTDKLKFATDPVVSEEGVLLGGDENVRGRYALHIHKAGTNNITDDPVHVKGCVVWGTPGWGIVNHSSNLIAEDNVVYDFVGAAYVTEAGNELGSFLNNLALKGRGNDLYPDGTAFSKALRAENFDLAYEGDGFWFHGVNISCEGNIAASCMGTGFHVFADDDNIVDTKKIKVPATTILNPAIAGTDDSVYTYILPMRENSNTTVYNSARAMNFWTYMFNADNIGDFSDAHYQEYSHDILSIVEDFNCWNLLEGGLDVTYSSQVHFKNGILLGDPEYHYEGPFWSVTDIEGYAVTTSIVTGQFIFENCTVKGWRYAMGAFRTDNSITTDGLEHNYRTSKIIGGVFEDNYYNLFPEKGVDYDLDPDYFQFPKYFEISGSPVFTPYATNTLPVSNFTYSAAGGTSVFFNGVLAYDPDPETSNVGNGIAAYSWDFGDGNTGYGQDIAHHYSSAGTYNVTLTVYDCQGQTNSFSKNVVVVNTAYKNQILDSGFETLPLITSTTISSNDTYVNKGWIKNDEWTINGGKASIVKSISSNKPLIQVIQNDYVLQGNVDFSFQVKNLGGGATGNTLWVEVTGVNGEFVNVDIENLNNIEKWLNNDTDFEKELLLSGEYGMSSYDWTTFTENIDFGSGYQFIVIAFYSNGLKNGTGDNQGVDNVCLPCNCAVPAVNFETQLTSTHVNLVWENVGASNYEVQFKVAGGTWTTYSVNNTFKDFSDLTANKTYNWRVRAYCEGSWTAYSPVRKFITPVTGSSCTSPTQTSASLITSTSATLSWNQIPGAINYQVQYRKSGSAGWTNVTVSTPYVTLNTLVAGSTYNWKVRTQCTEGWKSYTNTYSFTTLPLKEGEINGDDTNVEISVYPNPATENVTVTAEGFAGGATIQITDLAGRTILLEETYLQPGVNELQVDVQDIPAGVYILEIRCANGMKQSEKLLIE